MKRKVSVILIALIMLTACAKKPEADEQKQQAMLIHP